MVYMWDFKNIGQKTCPVLPPSKRNFFASNTFFWEQQHSIKLFSFSHSHFQKRYATFIQQNKYYLMNQASSQKEGEMDDLPMGAQWNVTNISFGIILLKVFMATVSEKRFALPSFSTFQTEFSSCLLTQQFLRKRDYLTKKKKKKDENYSFLITTFVF